MPAARRLVAGRIPGEEIAYTELGSDSDPFDTAEVEIMTIDAPVVAGRIYWVEFHPCVRNSTDNQVVQVRIREDNASGNNLGTVNHPLSLNDASSTGFGCPVSLRYTADVTETKTFVGTCDGFGVTPTDDFVVESTGPTWMRVTYVRG